MALNRIPIYNDYDCGGVLEENAWGTFDASDGHLGPREDYHYHSEGTYLTVNDAELIGFLRDGFPVYRRKNVDGTYPDNLDEVKETLPKKNRFFDKAQNTNTGK